MESNLKDNPFFALLPAQMRDRLCESCRLCKYAKGQRLSYHYWENQVAVLEDGLFVYTDAEEDGRVTTSGLASRGALVSPGSLIDVWDMPTANRDVVCFLDSTVIVFDDATVNELSEELMFIRALYDNILQHCMAEKQRFLKNVGGNDSYKAVRYVLEWCQKHQIPQLTHEQLAAMCNRSRPTVTQVIHAVLMQEPELCRVS